MRGAACLHKLGWKYLIFSHQQTLAFEWSAIMNIYFTTCVLQSLAMYIYMCCHKFSCTYCWGLLSKTLAGIYEEWSSFKREKNYAFSFVFQSLNGNRKDWRIQSIILSPTAPQDEGRTHGEQSGFWKVEPGGEVLGEISEQRPSRHQAGFERGLAECKMSS